MKPLTKKQAIKRFNIGKSVLIVYPDNTHATVNSATIFDNKGQKFGYEPNNDSINYYTKELSRINTNTGYAPTIVIHDSAGNKTKYISLNSDSKEVIIKWLKDNF